MNIVGDGGLYCTVLKSCGVTSVGFPSQQKFHMCAFWPLLAVELNGWAETYHGGPLSPEWVSGRFRPDWTLPKSIRLLHTFINFSSIFLSDQFIIINFLLFVVVVIDNGRSGAATLSNLPRSLCDRKAA